jgi:outer membrane protein OmpA-like peptidoglycan-associated protein
MKKLIISGLCLLFLNSLQAQKSEQYLHFNLGGGLNNLSYSLLNGTEKPQLGYTVNAAYSYFFNTNWGIQTGVGVKSYGAKSTLNVLTTENRIDTDNTPFELRTNYNNWQEKQNALFFEIPLIAQYKRSFNEKFGMLASAGAKIGIPLNCSYKSAGGEITTTGYYSQWNVELSDLPQHGLLTTTGDYKGNYSLKNAYMAVANLGGLYKLSPKIDLYAGLYLNYGLNNVLTPDSKLIYQFDGVYNGVLSSNQTKHLKPVSAGIKIGLYLKLGQRKQIVLPVEVIPQAVADSMKFESRILNSKTNQPVAATVIISKNGEVIKTLQTDENGKILVDLPKGEKYDLEIKAPGYVAQKQQLDFTNPSMEVQQNIALTAEKRNIVLVAKAIDAKTNAPVNATMIIKDANETVETVIADKDGVLNVEVPEGKAYQIEIEAPDYVSQSHTVDLTAGIMENKKEIALTPMVKVEKDVVLKFNRINYRTGANKITPEQVEVLNSISQTLIENPETIVEVSGHTDNVGDPRKNVVLSKKRANEVVKYLVSKGVNRSQLVVKGYGKTKPVADNRTEKGRFENRRVDFKVIK